MEIEFGIQPNCSELVISLPFSKEREALKALKELGIEQIRTYYCRDCLKDVANNPKDYAQHLKELHGYKVEIERNKVEYFDPKKDETTKRVTNGKLELIDRDNPYLPDVEYHADLWLGGLSSSSNNMQVWYHQHCQAQGFPTLLKISRQFDSEVLPHDGGSLAEWEDFLKYVETSSDKSGIGYLMMWELDKDEK